MLRLSTGAVLALCLFASPATAEPFDDFVNLCVNNDGRREVVVAKAEQRGWFRMPAEALPNDGEFQDIVAFLSASPETLTKGVPADIRMVMVARGNGEKILGVASLEMEACAVVMLGETIEGGSWSDRLERTLGFSSTTIDVEPLWVFSREGAGFRSEADLMDLPDDQLIVIAKQRDLYIAGVLDGEYEGLLFAAIRPAE